MLRDLALGFAILIAALLAVAVCAGSALLLFACSSSSSAQRDDEADARRVSAQADLPPYHSVLEHFTAKGGRYDGKAVWTLEDGALVGREGPGHAGGLLYTLDRYEHVDVSCEVRIDHPFDSGIFFRMGKDGKGPQVTLDDRPGGEIGGIYADGWWCHAPHGVDAWKRDAWNHVRARCVGHPAHISVWINDVLVCDHQLPADAEGFAREGMVGFQVHGGADTPPEQAVRIRRVEIRRLIGHPHRQPYAGGQAARTHFGQGAGWQDLLADGLDAWEVAGDGTGFRVQDGVLELLHAGGAPHLLTKDDYADFHLALDFQIQDMANSGIFLRAARDGSNPAFSGREVQILDDHNWERVTGSTLKPWQFTGSLYGAVPPARRVLRPSGTWNHMEIICRGTRQITSLNGVVLHDVDTHALDVKPPFAERAPTGFLGIQRHAPGGTPQGEVYARFRNVFIRALPASAPTPPR